MMYLTLIFWLVLAVPGYAAVRRWFKDDLACGLLGVIGLSYLATFALLSPIAILGYVLGVPLWVFSSAVLALIAWGAADVSRTGGWKDLRDLVRRSLGIEIVIILAVLSLDVLVGSIFHGDALVHIARIRFLIDHGLTNQDPFIAADAFYPIYHTNLLHALYASASQLTFTDHLGTWHMSLAWSKLLCASGGYLLGWFVFRKPWAAWACALFIVAHRGPVPFMAYPNSIAPFFMLPVLIGLAVQAIADGADKRTWIRIGAATLVLGQMHGLYVLFAALALGPVMAVVAVHRWIRKADDRTWLLAGAAALLIGLPFPLVSKMTTRPFSYESTDLRGFDADRDQFIAVGSSMRMRNPNQGFMQRDMRLTPEGPVVEWAIPWRPVVLVAGCVIGVLTTRRRAVWVVAAVTGIVVASLYVPPTATALLEVLGREWILVRFEVLLMLCTAALAPAAVAMLVETHWPHWALRIILALAAFVCGDLVSGRSSQQNPAYNWSFYFHDAFDRSGRAAEGAAMPPPRLVLGNWRAHRDFFEDAIDPGGVVLANVSSGMMAVALVDANVVYSASSSLGVHDLERRRLDFETMVNPTTEWAYRSQLLRTYGVTHILTVNAETPPWAARYTVDAAHSPQLRIYITEIMMP